MTENKGSPERLRLIKQRHALLEAFGPQNTEGPAEDYCRREEKIIQEVNFLREARGLAQKLLGKFKGLPGRIREYSRMKGDKLYDGINEIVLGYNPFTCQNYALVVGSGYSFLCDEQGNSERLDLESMRRFLDIIKLK